jgi:hypothetical protein
MTADQLLDALLDAGSYRSWDGPLADVRPEPGYAAELARARFRFRLRLRRRLLHRRRRLGSRCCVLAAATGRGRPT